MTRFCRKTWEERARRKGPKRLDRDLTAIANLERLMEWCAEEGLEVEFKRIAGGEYDPDASMIAISSNASPETQVFTLLHECGHHVFRTSFAACIHTSAGARAGSLAHAVNNLTEEFEAWRLGACIACKMEIELNERWHRYRMRCLATYIEWAATRGWGYSDE